MIYHICPPDKLFVYQAIETFEAIKADYNKCIIIISANHNDPKHNIDKKYVDYCGPYNVNVTRLINNSQCKGVVLHTLNEDLLNLALSIKNGIPIYWRSWGADLHDILYPKFDPLEPETKKIIHGCKYNVFVKKMARPIYQFINGSYRDWRSLMKRKLLFLKKVDFISTVTMIEYEKLIQKVPLCTAKKMSPHIYTSYSIGKRKVLNQNENAKGIMIGHSSFPYHNHVDTFKLLQRMRFHPSKLIVPLNYGEQEYAKTINSLGMEMFKDRFCPILDFIELDEYRKIIDNCFAFVLNSKIQSGAANIGYFLLQGLKVYLHEDNPLYHDLKGTGYRLFSIQKELTYEHLYNYRLSDEERTTNFELRKVANSHASKIKNILEIYRAFNIDI